MRKITLGANFTIFVLFFGLALFEAFQTRDWIRAAFWMAIAVVFLAADNLKNPSSSKS